MNCLIDRGNNPICELFLFPKFLRERLRPDTNMTKEMQLISDKG